MRNLATAVIGLAVAAAAPALMKSADYYLIGCDMLTGEVLQRCKSVSENFRETYAKAMQGDYEGLMNAAAFMLERNDHTEGYPAKQGAIVGCSWSLVETPAAALT